LLRIGRPTGGGGGGGAWTRGREGGRRGEGEGAGGGRRGAGRVGVWCEGGGARGSNTIIDMNLEEQDILIKKEKEKIKILRIV
jgi:hypothetical protein